MKKFVITSLTAAGFASNSDAQAIKGSEIASTFDNDWIEKYQNDDLPFTLAGHRSHSSHSSHGSHRSSSSSVTPSYRAPSISTPPTSTLPSKPTLRGNSNAFMELAKRIQIELMIVDLYRGPIDGIVGPKTLEAIMKYQRLKGLPVTGNIDETLLRAMNLR